MKQAKQNDTEKRTEEGVGRALKTRVGCTARGH